MRAKRIKPCLPVLKLRRWHHVQGRSESSSPLVDLLPVNQYRHLLASPAIAIAVACVSRDVKPVI